MEKQLHRVIQHQSFNCIHKSYCQTHCPSDFFNGCRPTTLSTNEFLVSWVRHSNINLADGVCCTSRLPGTLGWRVWSTCLCCFKINWSWGFRHLLSGSQLPGAFSRLLHIIRIIVSRNMLNLFWGFRYGGRLIWFRGLVIHSGRLELVTTCHVLLIKHQL